MNVKQLIQIEPGWRACFLINWNKSSKVGTYTLLPVVCLGLTETLIHDEYEQAVQPFIMRTNGEIVLANSLKYPLVCMVGPGESARAIVAMVDDAYRDTSWREAPVMREVD